MPIDKNIEDLELNDLDTDTIAIDDLEQNSELDSIDLDISEIESTSFSNFSEESNDGDTSLLKSDTNDFKDENIEELEDEKIKIDSDIDLNLDFDSVGEEEKLSNAASDTEEIDLSLEESFKEIDKDITQSYKGSESELDIKNDLGLEDELSLDLDENNNIDENFDLDITDDMGNKIDLSEEEFGVDLKSGPITIDFFDEKNKIEDVESDTIIDFDELDEKISKDQDVLKLNIPEKKPLTLDEEQTKYLEQEIDEEKIDLNLEDNFEDIDKDLKEFSIDEEEIDNLSLESLEDEALKKSESLVTDEEIANLEIENEKELDLSLDNIDTEEIEEATLADDEIKIEKSPNIEESIDENLEEFENIEYDSEVSTSPLDEEIDLNIELEQEKGKDNLEEEKIMLDQTELSEVEEVIFPDDENMPELDEDIKNVGVNESTLTDSISPLTDTESVFSEEITVEEIPEEKMTLEEMEDESLSPTELDNIINSTELIETPAEEILEENLEEEKIKLDDNEIEGLENIEEDNLALEEIGVDLKEEPQTIDESMESETIDLSNFEAELVDTKEEEVQALNISKEEEEDIYNSLRSEMESKKREEPKELKEQVKLVLSYLDQLLDSLPEEKIKEFAESKTFEIYRKLFEELNIKS